jgi:hypothetical protein
MKKLSSMPATEVAYHPEDGSVSISQHQDQGDVAVYFPVQMALTIADLIKAAAAEHNSVEPTPAKGA